MRKITVSLLVALFSAATSQAASIIAQAALYNGLSDSTGAGLAAGNQVRIGTFTLTDSQIQVAFNSNNFTLLNSSFQLYGAAHIGDNVGGSAGYFQNTIIGTTATLPVALANAQVYLWAFKTTGNNDPNGSFSNVTATGIFYVNKTNKDSWRFRPDAEVPSTSTIDLADLTGSNGVTNSNVLVTGASVVVGSFPGGNSTLIPGARNFNLASVVPEPTSLALLAMGLVSFVTYRRRTT